MISVIIRTRNEQQWLRPCLAAVTRQEYVDFEVIVVDNHSTDASLQIAEQFDVKIVEISIDEFTYGRAINRGVQASQGDLICCLSGHCIPENSAWLFWLCSALQDSRTAGVYGRQTPIRSTNVLDKRDLWNLFGPERKVQTKDPFFHNANSMIRRSIWDQVPFDESTTGLEDRIWARHVLALGYQIVYEPRGAVHHPHGVNQAGDVERAERVVEMIERHRLNGNW